MMKKKLVIIGNGMVTDRFLDELDYFSPDYYDITIISAENYGSYNRIMLSAVLSGDKVVSDIIKKTPKWYRKKCITLHQGEFVLHINSAKQQLFTSKRKCISYDHLIIATGSRPTTIPSKNQNLRNIFTFRSIADTEKLLSKTSSSKHAIVIGGGFLGLEAAWGLAKRGIKVTVVHRGTHILNKQLDAIASQMLQRQLEQLGLKFYLANEVTAFKGKFNVKGAYLKNQIYLECDMAVMATGITPNAEIAWNAGLTGTRGIEVDKYMSTSIPHISAIGECTEFNQHTFGLVDPLWQQAKVLAHRLCQKEITQWLTFNNQATATRLKISQIQLFSAGVIDVSHTMQELVIHDPLSNIYRKLIIENNHIVGIILFGDIRSGSWYFDLMKAQTDITTMLPTLVLGQEYIAA